MRAGKEHPFSARHLEIILLVADGKEAEVIGDLLGISKHTVETHKRNMLARHGGNNIYHLILISLEKGWLRLDREGEI